MKILNITPFNLFPVTAGNQSLTYNLCEYLESKGHSIGYVFVDYGIEHACEDLGGIDWLEYRSVPGAISRAPGKVIKKIVNRLAFALGRSNIDPVFFLNSEDIEEIKQSINTHEYDAVILHYAVLGELMRHIEAPDLKSIIITHDLQFIRESRINRARFGVFGFRSKTCEKLELNRYKNFDKVVMVSSNEYDVLAEKGIERNRMLLCGSSHKLVDTRGKAKEWDLLFVGSGGNWPNVQGMTWFLKEVWPEVIRENPKASLAIAGTICRSVSGLDNRNTNVTLLGFVDSLEEVYGKSRFIIAPLLTGSGVKVKVVEALSHAKALISSNHGVEGLNLTDKEEFLLAESKDEWSKIIIDAIASDAVSKDLEDAAYNWAKSNASHEAVWGNVEQFIND